MKGIPVHLESVGPHHIVIDSVGLRHIGANVQKEFNDKTLHVLLWEAGVAHDPKVYKAKRAKLKAVCEYADVWIENSLKDQEHKRALSKDEGHRLCMMTTNAPESLNGVLKGAQALSIQALIVRIFFRLVRFFRTRRGNAEGWNKPLTPQNDKILCHHQKWHVFILDIDSIEMNGRCQAGKDILALFNS